jgi:hypothetical protein
VIQLNEPARFKKQGARLEMPKLSEPHLKSKRGTNQITNSKNEQTLATKRMTTGTYLGMKMLPRHQLVEAHSPDRVKPTA